MSATVNDVMTTRVAAVTKNAPFKDIAASLARYRSAPFLSWTMTARSLVSYPRRTYCAKKP